MGEDAKQLAVRQREEEEEVLLAAEAEVEAAEEAATAIPRSDMYAAATDRYSIGSFTASRGCDELRRFAAIAEGRTRKVNGENISRDARETFLMRGAATRNGATTLAGGKW